MSIWNRMANEKRIYLYKSPFFHSIAYGVVGHSLQATNALVSVLTNAHKYPISNFSTFYIYVYKG